MDPLSTATLLGNVVLGLAKRAGATLWDKLSTLPPTQAAIDATVDAFPELEGLTNGLRDWSDSACFRKYVEAAHGERDNLTDEDIIASFLEVTDFYFGEETESKAQEVLNTFFRRLQEELYRSPDGLIHLSHKMDAGHAEVSALIREVRGVGRADSAAGG